MVQGGRGDGKKQMATYNELHKGLCLSLKGRRLSIGVPLYEQRQTQEYEKINYALKRDTHRQDLLLGCKLELQRQN